MQKVIFSSQEQQKHFIRIAKQFRNEGATRLFLAGSRNGGDFTPEKDVDLGAEFPYLTEPIAYRQDGNIHVIAMPMKETENAIVEAIRKTGRTFWMKR